MFEFIREKITKINETSTKELINEDEKRFAKALLDPIIDKDKENDHKSGDFKTNKPKQAA